MRVAVLTPALLLAALGSAAAAERPALEAPQSVRACPEQGPGFFKIPGSDSCIRLGGRVSSEVGVASRRVSRDDVAGFGAQARVSADVRTNTEYGPLRAYMRVRAGQGTTSRD